MLPYLDAGNNTASTPHRKKALRMSMIQSAQVFSPRPSQNPYQNLRILQSPLKPFKTPSKLDNPHANAEDTDDQEVVLVDGNRPRVVQEEKDLVILEDVEVEVDNVQHEQQRTPARANYTPSLPHNVPRASFPPSILQPLQTPRRRIPGESLHRAVLIRSAQRAVLKAEIEKEEQEEEKEVEEVIATDVVTASSQSSENETEEEDEKKEDETEETPKRVLGWRKSLESVRIWPFFSANPIPEQDENQATEDAEVCNTF
jgi:hypothetical protein